MALTALLDNIDSLSESDQRHYEKVGEGVHSGKFRAVITPVSGETGGKKWSLSLDDVGGIRQSLEDRKAKHETAQRLLDTFKGEDGELLDPASMADALVRLESLKDAVGKDKVEAIVVERIGEYRKKFATDLATRDTTLAKQTKQLHKVVVQGAALAALAKAAPEQVEILLPHVLQRLGIDDKAEIPTHFVIGENGNPRFSLKAGAGPEDLMQADELVAEMGLMPAFAPAFPSSERTGTGAPASSGGALGANGAVTLTREQAQDPATYQKAKAEAAKRNVPFTVP